MILLTRIHHYSCDVFFALQPTKQVSTLLTSHHSLFNLCVFVIGIELINTAILGKDTSFPTLQVRVVRFYVSCRPPSSPPPPPPPGLNHKCRMAVFPTGPQPRASAGHVPGRTSTASFGGQCSPLDLNRELRLAVFPAGPQQRVRRYARKDARKNLRKSVRRKNAEKMFQYMPENL